MDLDERDGRRILACLGDVSRFRLVRAMSSGPVCVTELASIVGLSQSCTTRHLQSLSRCGVTGRERDGKRVIYRLRTDRADLMALVEWAMTQAPGLKLDPSSTSAIVPRLIIRRLKTRRRMRVPLPAPKQPETAGAGVGSGREGSSGTRQTTDRDVAIHLEAGVSEPRVRAAIRRGRGDIEDFLL
jgi:DNA-binding transcriptional ArsR family regulator